MDLLKQISGITDGMDSGRTQTYTYDNLARLLSASTTGSTAYPAWGLSWTYDRYNNRTAQSITTGTSACTGITCPTNSLTVSATTNQVTGTGFGYDSNGNMTGDGINTLTFDAMNTSISSSGYLGSGAYSYDGNGLRAIKSVPISSPTTTTVYIFSGGKVIAEYDNGAAVGSPIREYIYSGGNLIAKIAGSTTTYYHQDLLSNRLLTNSTGAVNEQLGHFPFGETWYDTGSEKWKFTTYERDAESANDYAMARYNVNRLGRFSSADLLGGTIDNPQSLNRYTYASNDPINAVDPTGESDYLVNCVLTIVTTYIKGTPTGPPTFTVYCQKPDTHSGGGSYGSTGGGSGGGGGGGGGFVGRLLNKIKKGVCSALPDAGVSGISASIGGVAGGTGSVEVLTNYFTGEQNFFLAGGLSVSNGLQANLSVVSGFVFNLGNSNSNYSGGFINGGYAPNVFGPVSMGPSASVGTSNSPPIVVGGSVGVNFTTNTGSVTGSWTTYSRPFGSGNITQNPNAGLIDSLLFVAKQACKQ